MSSLANLVAFDGATTPISHTFLPLRVENGVGSVKAFYRESLTGVPIYGQPAVTITQGKRSKNGLYRSEILVEIPVMEAVLNQNASGYTAQPKVAHVVTTGFYQIAHERSDIAVRRLARQLAVNITNGLATTQTVTTTGPASELIDQLIVPT